MAGRGAGEAVASWEVEGAWMRQNGEAVELVDEGAWGQLRVTAPVAYAAGGREVKTRLAVRSQCIELYVAAEGGAVLVDPLWVVMAPMSFARAYPTATLLGNGKVLSSPGYVFPRDPPRSRYIGASQLYRAVRVRRCR